jgi:hypothetical protein
MSHKTHKGRRIIYSYRKKSRKQDINPGDILNLMPSATSPKTFENISQSGHSKGAKVQSTNSLH